MRIFQLNYLFEPAIYRYIMPGFFLLVLSGCIFPRVMGDDINSPESERSVNCSDECVGADYFLGILKSFNAADASKRDKIYEDTIVDASLHTDARYRLQLALLKSVKNHRGYNLETAETLINNVIDNAAGLSVSAVTLARLYAEFIRDRKDTVAQLREMEKRLAEANDKIEALTAIEKSVPPSLENNIQQPLENGRNND